MDTNRDELKTLTEIQVDLKGLLSYHFLPTFTSSQHLDTGFIGCNEPFTVQG